MGWDRDRWGPKSPQLISHPPPGQHAGDTETPPVGVHEVECEHDIYNMTPRGREMHMRGTPTDRRVMGRAQDEGGEEMKIEEVKSVRQKGGHEGSSERGCGWGVEGGGARGELRSPLPLDELALKLHLSLKQEQEKDG